MKIEKNCKCSALIIAIAVLFTVFTAFSGIGAVQASAASEIKANAADKVTSFNRKLVVKNDILPVRSGASATYTKLTSLKKGAVIYAEKKVVKSSGAVWYRFDYNGRDAYVNGGSKYVTVTATVSETKLDNLAVIDDGPLNVRSGPGTSYSKLGTVAENEKIRVLLKIKRTNGSIWYKFKYSSSKYGYVSAEYVTLTNIRNEDEFVRKAIVNSSTLPMRVGPGASYDRAGTLEKGDEIFTQKKIELVTGAVWYQYKYNNKTVYSNGSSKYMTLTEIVSETKVNKKASATTSVNIRKGPALTYEKLGLLKKGEVITALEKIQMADGSYWYKFKFSSEEYGYVNAAYVQLGTGVTFKVGIVTTDSGVTLNVRSGPGTGYDKIGSLTSGAIVTVLSSKKASNGKIWYEYQFSSKKTGWICSDYVELKTISSTAAFEEYLDEQGFPDSYKPALRVLKSEHPNWVFKAYDVGCTWATAVNKENAKPGLNVIDTSLPKSWRSKDKDCYNAETGVWSRYDGRWYSAHTDVIRYYMDPRNFLNDNGIYQFLTHKYDGETQSIDTVKAVVKGTFMETRKPGGWLNFASLINAAGKKSGVNPNVLAAMIIQEQGTKGTSGLISGTYSGYKGYYNFLNIGAYTTSTMTAVQRGLWYAKQQGWDSEYRSIKGGADIYHDNYIERNQYTFYTKKFNVMNGTDKIGSHQYMTNVQGAYGEAVQLKKAFPENYSKALTFIIPVYDSMPASPCDLP